MNVRHFITIIILAIIFFSSLTSVVLALDANNDLKIEKDNIGTEEVLSKKESLSEKELDLEEENINIIDNSNNEKNLNTDEEVDDNEKVSEQVRELLKMSDISDVNELSSKITDIQMKNLIAELKFSNTFEKQKLPLKKFGICVAEDSRKVISDFINNHSSYTYSVDKNGYLVCDKTLRKNENLELVEPQETEMDIGINNVLAEEKLIIIKISNCYYSFNNKDLPKSVKFDSDTYSKAYEINNTRVVLLNEKYYSIDNINYNLPLSDNFIKVLDNIQYKVIIGEIELGQEKVTNSNELKTTSFSDNGQALRKCKNKPNSLFWT